MNGWIGIVLCCPCRARGARGACIECWVWTGVKIICFGLIVQFISLQVAKFIVTSVHDRLIKMTHAVIHVLITIISHCSTTSFTIIRAHLAIL